MAEIDSADVSKLINAVNDASAAHSEDKLDLTAIVTDYYTSRYGMINFPMIEFSGSNRQDAVSPNQMLFGILINLRAQNVKLSGGMMQRILAVKKLAEKETNNLDERIKSKHRLIMEVLLIQSKVNPDEAHAYFAQLFGDGDGLLEHVYADLLTAMTNPRLALQLDKGQLRQVAEKFLTQPGIVEAIRSVVNKIRGGSESEGIDSDAIVAEARSFRLYTCAHACGWFRGVCLRDGILIIFPTTALSTMPDDHRHRADVLQLIMHVFTHFVLRKLSPTFGGFNVSSPTANTGQAGRECEVKVFGRRLEWSSCQKEGIAKTFVELALSGIIQETPIVLFEANINEVETGKMKRHGPSISFGGDVDPSYLRVIGC